MTYLQELRNQLKELKAKPTDSMSVEEIKSLTDDINAINAKISLEVAKGEEVSDMHSVEATAPVRDGVTNFVDAVLRHDRTAISNLRTEGTNADGGFLVPEEISTKIEEFERLNFSISPYVRHQTVSSLKGAKTIVTNEPTAAGFASLDEADEIQALHEPTFGRMDYEIHKFGGYIQATNELIADSTDNIINFLAEWMGRNHNNTINYQVFNGSGATNGGPEGILTEMTSTGKLNGYYDTLTAAPAISKFKSIINVKMADIPKSNRKLYTNEVGYNYLDNLSDTNGHPYIQPDLTKATDGYFLGIPIVVVPSKYLTKSIDVNGTPTAHTPFIIGDLASLYTIFDRKQISIESTTVGGDTWRKDKTELKGIFRFDGRLNDVKACYTILVPDNKLA